MYKVLFFTPFLSEYLLYRYTTTYCYILSRCTEMNSFEEKLSIDYDNQVSAFVWERCQMLLQKRIFPSIAHNYIE